MRHKSANFIDKLSNVLLHEKTNELVKNTTDVKRRQRCNACRNPSLKRKCAVTSTKEVKSRRQKRNLSRRDETVFQIPEI